MHQPPCARLGSLRLAQSPDGPHQVIDPAWVILNWTDQLNWPQAATDGHVVFKFTPAGSISSRPWPWPPCRGNTCLGWCGSAPPAGLVPTSGRACPFAPQDVIAVVAME